MDHALEMLIVVLAVADFKMLIVVWAVAEFIQYLRKRPFRSRMKTGAWWGCVLSTLAMYGQQLNLGVSLLFIDFAMMGLVALVIYWARVGLAKAWTGPATSQAFALSQNASSQMPRNTVNTNYDENYCLVSPSITAKVPTEAPISLPVGSSMSEQNSLELASSVAVQAPTAQLNTAAQKTNNSVSNEFLLMEEMEDVIYERIGAELESKTPDKGVWTKAYAITGGDDTKTRVLYIKLRFEKLHRIEQSKLAAEKIDQEEKSSLEIENHQQQKAQEIDQKSKLIVSENSASPDIKSNGLSGIPEATRFLNLIRYGHTQKVLQMLRNNPSLVSAQDNSALPIAVSENHVHLARVLAEAGAKFSPTDFANVHIKEFLEKNKISINQ